MPAQPATHRFTRISKLAIPAGASYLHCATQRKSLCIIFSLQSGEHILQEFTVHPDLRIRPATPEDLPVLRTLIEDSVRRLQAQDYTPAQMEAALVTVFGVDTQLVADGTYLVVEHWGSASSPDPLIIACGGWSKRKTLFGADQWTQRQDDLLDPNSDAAKIRAFFIHPDWARRGVGTLLLDACESAAKSAGFSRFEMGATLTGAKLFSARGYHPIRNLEVPLSNGQSLPIIQMEKSG
jgi:GNAT superfamily N-acetyltransferase